MSMPWHASGVASQSIAEVK